MTISDLTIGQKFFVIGRARETWASEALVLIKFGQETKPGETKTQPVAFTDWSVYDHKRKKNNGGIYWPIDTPVELA
jgi:hypothetical protein